MVRWISAALTVLACLSVVIASGLLISEYVVGSQPAEEQHAALVSADPSVNVPLLPRVAEKKPVLSGILPTVGPSLGTTVRGLGQAVTGAVQAATETPRRVPARVTVSNPTRVRIPKIGVDSPIISLHLTERQEITTPGDALSIGWWDQTVSPGNDGVSLLAGHRDWAGNQGAFYKLKDLRPGDTIEVVGADGAKAPFVVWQSEVYPAAGAPSGDILRRDGPPSLVLVTCEGQFDTVIQDYSHRRAVLAVHASVATQVSR